MKKIEILLPMLILLVVVSWGIFQVRESLSAPDEGQPSCMACHENVGLKLPKDHPAIDYPDAGTMVLIKQIFELRKSSSWLDATHAQNAVTCKDCHGNTMPESDITVENEICLGCHGSFDELAQLTVNTVCAEKNPHKSHLGEIDCTVCHHAHDSSEAYCLKCHSNFKMGIPGSGK